MTASLAAILKKFAFTLSVLFAVTHIRLMSVLCLYDVESNTLMDVSQVNAGPVLQQQKSCRRNSCRSLSCLITSDGKQTRWSSQSQGSVTIPFHLYVLRESVSAGIRK